MKGDREALSLPSCSDNACTLYLHLHEWESGEQQGFACMGCVGVEYCVQALAALQVLGGWG